MCPVTYFNVKRCCLSPSHGTAWQQCRDTVFACKNVWMCHHIYHIHLIYINWRTLFWCFSFAPSFKLKVAFSNKWSRSTLQQKKYFSIVHQHLYSLQYVYRHQICSHSFSQGVIKQNEDNITDSTGLKERGDGKNVYVWKESCWLLEWKQFIAEWFGWIAWVRECEIR